VQAYVKSVEAEEATEHIGRRNRLARRRWNIVEALKARGQARQVLERLAEHSNGQVRANAKSALDRLDKPAQEFAPEPLREPQILWQCDHPPPAALTRDEIAQRLRQSVPVSRDRLMDLALPAIGLWPQRLPMSPPRRRVWAERRWHRRIGSGRPSRTSRCCLSGRSIARSCAACLELNNCRRMGCSLSSAITTRSRAVILLA
jgi:hypothetical protein